MQQFFKKVLKGFFGIFTFLLFPFISFAQSGPTGPAAYTPLAPIGTIVNEQTISAATQSLSAYINSLFTLGIAAAGFLAVIMIIIGGIQYMGSDVVTSKADAKGRIQNAVLGLVLALSTYLILNTINSDFLNTELAVDQQNIAVQDQLGAAVSPTVDRQNAAAGIPSNPVVSSSYNSAGAFITTYRDGSSQAFYSDTNGQQYVANYDPNGEQVGAVRNVSNVTYSGTLDANGNYAPQVFYYDDGTRGSPGGSGSFGNTSSINGSIVAMTNGGKTFPNDAWNNYALEQIRASNLLNLNPADAATYFPNGITAEGYLNLLAAMASRESSFNPNTVYRETGIEGNPNSVGLLQLSYGDSVVRSLGFSEEDLKDPFKNIQAAVLILQNSIQSGNCITCSNGTYQTGRYAGQPRYVGASAYWSTLRPGR